MPAAERTRPPGVDLGLGAGPINGQILFEHLDTDLDGRTTGRHSPTLLTLAAIILEQSLALLLLFLPALPATLGGRLPIPTASSALGLQLRERLVNARRARARIDQVVGHLIAPPARPVQLVLGGIGGRMLGRCRSSRIIS